MRDEQNERVSRKHDWLKCHQSAKDQTMPPRQLTQEISQRSDPC